MVERQPKIVMEAAKLADDYHLARKGQDRDIKHNGNAPMKPGIKCLKCGKIEHIARECRGTSLRPEIKTNGEGKRNERTRKELKDVECFNWRKKGHYSSNCPDHSLLCVERRMDLVGEVRTSEQKIRRKPLGVIKCGTVERHQVDDILIDTGCSRAMIHRDNIPDEKILPGEAIAIRC